MYREKHSPSLCPTSRPLLRLRVYENHRIKGQAIGRHSRASLKLLHDPYLAVAGVGPILLKPRKDVPEGKRTESISVMGRYSTARRLLLGQLRRGFAPFTSGAEAKERGASSKEAGAISGNVVQSIFRVFTAVIYKQHKLANNVHKC